MYPQAVQDQNVNFSPSGGAEDSGGARENGSPGALEEVEL